MDTALEARKKYVKHLRETLVPDSREALRRIRKSYLSARRTVQYTYLFGAGLLALLLFSIWTAGGDRDSILYTLLALMFVAGNLVNNKRQLASSRDNLTVAQSYHEHVQEMSNLTDEEWEERDRLCNKWWPVALALPSHQTSTATPDLPRSPASEDDSASRQSVTMPAAQKTPSSLDSQASSVSRYESGEKEGLEVLERVRIHQAAIPTGSSEQDARQSLVTEIEKAEIDFSERLRASGDSSPELDDLFLTVLEVEYGLTRSGQPSDSE